jgi:hypothetical protein
VSATLSVSHLVALCGCIPTFNHGHSTGYAKEVPEKLAKLQSIIDDPRTENEEIHETRKRAEKTLKLLEATINILINVSTP